MSEAKFSSSRAHDLAGSVLGVFAIVMLLSSRWQVDTSGPDPFYKGPLIFPIIVFSLMLLGALPSMWRLVRPPKGASWSLDGYGHPVKNTVILGLLVIYLAGLITAGLEISTFLFLLAAMKLVKQDAPWKLLVFPAGVTLVLFLVFKVFLDIWFPYPLILEWVLE